MRLGSVDLSQEVLDRYGMIWLPPFIPEPSNKCATDSPPKECCHQIRSPDSLRGNPWSPARRSKRPEDLKSRSSSGLEAGNKMLLDVFKEGQRQIYL